ncbi:Chitotriosidase-1 [Cytospora mali]|uniref:chitinase n=1 Tax=Cytospora mali TaxID=578113 RepID=A0A194V8P5_CYTMA|nr:Chitotriosidase-1 [Valsa mali var. pyri (nom. inval.)]
MASIRRPLFLLFSALLLVTLATLVQAGDGTCSSTSPCTSGCCSSSGFCGYGPNYCGDSCISSCNATAECGEYAAVPGTKCPLNVCCSGCGFCGTTTEFCTDTGSDATCSMPCQNGCDAVTKPSCSSATTSATKKRIGYYESWSQTRSCDTWLPSDIDASKWTHLNYAFALISDTYQVAQMNDYDTTLYTQFTDLKSQNAALKVFISVGGWDAGGAIFSSMTSTSANRAAFINSLLQFMKTYAFDGVDIDWEYPVTSDRGGNEADFVNYVTFLKELRAALGTSYGITATLPSSYWYMQNFDIVNMEPYLDWFNIMTYDIHGTWDGNNPYTQAVVQAHTNLTEIDEALDLLWRNGIDSSKVVLGLGFYGRSFTLKDSSCTIPGCPFASGANPGECTATSGILSDAEIQSIISANDLTPVLDQAAAVKYIVWDSDQWVSYDDKDTFATKMDYANKLCLAGTMVWALDLDSTGSNSSINNLALSGDKTTGTSIERLTAVSKSNSMSLGLFWTVCLPKDTTSPCPQGFRPIAWGHGKVFDADLQYNTGEGCHGGGINGFQRALCAANNVLFDSVQWGPGSASKACNSKCPNNWLTLTKNSHITGQKSGCKSGKYAPLCVYNMRALYTSSTCYTNAAGQVLSGGLSLREDDSGTADFDYDDSDSDGTALQVRQHREIRARKDERRQGQLQKRGFLSNGGCLGAIPYGDIAIDIPAKQFSFWDAGTSYYYFDATSIKSSSSTKKSKTTRTEYEHTTTTTYPVVTRTCDGNKYPQACYHYSSVAQKSTYSRATCSNQDKSNGLRPLTKSWNDGHKSYKRWNQFIAKSYVNPNNKRKSLNCQRDEWPPAHFQQGRADGWIRFLPGDQNGGIPNDGEGGWQGICKFPPQKRVAKEGGPITDMGNYYLMTSYTSTIITLNVMSYTWKNVNPPAGDPYGLTANVCRPSVLTADVGYALQTDDPWYGGRRVNAYNLDPGALTVGKSQPTYRRNKRGQEDGMVVFDFNEDDEGDGLRVTADDGNSTRLATDEEIEELGYVRCNTPDCWEELEELRQMQAEASIATETAAVVGSATDLVQASATATATLVGASTTGLEATRPTLVAFSGTQKTSTGSGPLPVETEGGGANRISSRSHRRLHGKIPPHMVDLGTDDEVFSV